MNWSDLITGVNNLGLECRLKGVLTDIPEDWTNFLIEPVAGYVESRCGPIPLDEVEWLLINPVHSTRRGRLVPPLLEDKSEALIALLNECGANYSFGKLGFTVYGDNR